MKVLKWVLIVVGCIGALMGLMILVSGDWVTCLEFLLISAAVISYGWRIGKPGAKTRSSSSDDNDWGSALDRD